MCNCVSRSSEHKFPPPTPTAPGVPAAAVDHVWWKLAVGCFVVFVLLELLKSVVAFLKS
jgi:hypothetical protein